MSISIKPVFSLDDGAYLIGRSTSYVNPLTGNTEDGGTNITLGDSMVSSIVESNLLLEQTAGKYYITVGLGLASNVSNVRFKIMNGSGAFKNVSATKTGSSSANGDTVNHYRIQVDSLDDYISPIMYVTPMGRDVQFFIKLDQSAIISGTGIYTSTMIPTLETNESISSNSTTDTIDSNGENLESSIQHDESIVNEDITITPNTAVSEVSKESLFEGVEGLSSYIIDENGKVNGKKKLTATNLLKNEVSKNENNKNILFITGSVFLVIIIGGTYYYVKKVKK